MGTPAMLQKYLLPIESVQLGRFVANPMQPYKDFLDPEHDPQPTDILIKPQENLKDILNRSRNSTIRSHLTALLSISDKRQETGTATLIAEKATTYQLLNSRDWFMNECAKAGTRTWLEKCLQYTEHVYLVVGYCTITNPFSTQISTGGEATGGGIQLSGLDDSAGGSAELNILGARVNPMRNVTDHRESTFSGAGEQIYAIQYLKLKFSWFSSREVGKSFLEPKNQWKVFWKPETRGMESDDDEDDDDMVQLVFTDEVDLTLDEVYISEEDLVG